MKTSGLSDDRPIVVAEKDSGSLRVVHAGAVAQEVGLVPGMTLADVRARVPEVIVVENDEYADRGLLQKIADWCGRYTPLVGFDGADGLILDISGCAHLLGGESNLRGDLMRRAQKMGFRTCCAVASTPDAARALARYSDIGICEPGQERQAVAPLPVAALGIDNNVVTALRRLGLKQITHLLLQPRVSLAARFGQSFVDILVRTLGEVERPITPGRPLPELAAEQGFPEPILQESQVMAALKALAAELCMCLKEQGKGGRCFETSLFRSDGDVRHIEILLSRPARNEKVITKLLSRKIESLSDPLDPGFGFDLLRLTALVSEDFHESQAHFDGSEDGDEVFELVDRLSAHLGAACVVRFMARNSHVPERAAKTDAAIFNAESGPAWPSYEDEVLMSRPINLFHQPEPIDVLAQLPDYPPARFRWRRMFRNVACAEGPERISSEWWNKDDPTRDYFRVEDLDGRRYWIYREGMYGEVTAPRWFVHGVFA